MFRVLDGGFREFQALEEVMIDANIHVTGEKKWSEKEKDQIEEEKYQIRFTIPFVVTSRFGGLWILFELC